MLYDECIENIAKLKELLVFQERRNFFNRTKDVHLDASISVVDAILNKTCKCEFSNSDLSDVINITSQIISMLNISEEIKEHILYMQSLSKKLREQNIDININAN